MSSLRSLENDDCNGSGNIATSEIGENSHGTV